MQFSTPAFHNQVLAGNTPRELSSLTFRKSYNKIADFLIMQIYL